MLWLDLGLWVEDRLYYALNAPKPPQDIQQLDNAEIITHMGYNYPEFERYFAASKAARIDQYTNAEMLKALYASPDRKSTRLNSSHVRISYAVFCLKKKKNTHM